MGRSKNKVFETDPEFYKDRDSYKKGWTVKNLKYFRTLRRLSKNKVVDELGVNMGVYNDWENCIMSPSLAEIVMLADYLHVSVDVLIGRKTGSYEYQVELSNLIFALNTQFEIVQHKLEEDDKCVFEIGNLKVAITSRELGVQDRRLPDEKIMEKVLSNAEVLDELYHKKEEEYRVVLEKREEEFGKMLERREKKFNEMLKRKEIELLKREERLKKKEKGESVEGEIINPIDFVNFTEEMIINDRLTSALKNSIGVSDINYNNDFDLYIDNDKKSGM